jgi:hypothetical protein
MAAYPQIPAEMPGVILSRHQPMPSAADTEPTANNKIDWENIADAAAWNANLEQVEHLPPPPPVIEVNDNDDIIYAPTPH